jgi:hypothetical protein
MMDEKPSSKSMEKLTELCILFVEDFIATPSLHNEGACRCGQSVKSHKRRLAKWRFSFVLDKRRLTFESPVEDSIFYQFNILLLHFTLYISL